MDRLASPGPTHCSPMALRGYGSSQRREYMTRPGRSRQQRRHNKPGHRRAQHDRQRPGYGASASWRPPPPAGVCCRRPGSEYEVDFWLHELGSAETVVDVQRHEMTEAELIDVLAAQSWPGLLRAAGNGITWVGEDGAGKHSDRSPGQGVTPLQARSRRDRRRGAGLPAGRFPAVPGPSFR